MDGWMEWWLYVSVSMAHGSHSNSSWVWPLLQNDWVCMGQATPMISNFPGAYRRCPHNAGNIPCLSL